MHAIRAGNDTLRMKLSDWCLALQYFFPLHYLVAQFLCIFKWKTICLLTDDRKTEKLEGEGKEPQ